MISVRNSGSDFRGENKYKNTPYVSYSQAVGRRSRREIVSPTLQSEESIIRSASTKKGARFKIIKVPWGARDLGLAGWYELHAQEDWSPNIMSAQQVHTHPLNTSN